MGERGPSPEKEGVKKVLDTGYYQGKLAQIVQKTKPDGISIEVYLIGENNRPIGIPTEAHFFSDVSKVGETLDLIRKSKHWEEMN